MPKSGEIQNVAIVGTGVIGASWAAEFLAHGFDVVATDPAPNAEPNLRKYIDAAWPALTAKGLAKRVERQTDIYSRSQKGGVACGLCSGERSGTAGSSPHFEAAKPALRGSRKGSLFMAEQFRGN